jgi:hypothetical protein
MTEMNRRTFEQRARSALQARSEALEPDVRRRLERARRQALASSRRPARPRWIWPTLATAGAAAALAIVVVLQPRHSPVPSAPQTADLDLLTRDDFELLTEDAEFFAWIAAQEETGDGSPAGDSTAEEERSG